MNNGKVTGDLVGGNLIDGTGAAEKITSTSVTLNDGTLNGEVMGGSYVRGSNTSSIDTTNVLVSGGELQSVNNKAQYVLGGGKALGYKDQQANLTIGTTNVTISDAVKVLGGGVIGGSLAKGTDNGTATVSVTKANTTILGGTQIAGVVGGGVAENYNTATGEVSSSVKESQLTIRGGTIDALRYGAQISDDGETASKAAVVGGGVASAKGTSGKVMSSVTTANTTINGGTINGNVFAGGLADGTSATANVTNANLTISGNAVITGNIHAGGYALNAGTATVANATVTFDGNSSFANKVFGQGHADDTSNATVTNSTLAFTNYNGAFNGQVVGFNNLDVAEGSTLQLATLSTGVAAEGDTSGVFNNNDLTLTGSGVVSADKVVADKALTVDSLATLTSGDIAVTTGSVTVEGTLDATGTVVTTTQDDINVAKGGILNVTTATALNGDFAGADLANGGTVNLTGTTDGELTVANLQGKFGSVGIINAGDNTVAGMFTEGTDPSSGTVSIDDITKSNIATNETKRLVVTGVTSTSELNGAWKGVELAEGASLTVNAGTLQLTGDAANVAVVNGDVAFNKNDSTLMLGDAGTANSGVIAGDVTFSNSASNMTLLVTGNQNAAFVVEGDIDGQGGTKGQLIAQGGATLTAKGDITAGTMTADGSAILAAGAADPAGAAGDIVAKNITAQNGGTIAAINDVTVTNVTLSNGAIAAGGDLTLNNGATNASGALVAGANIKATGQNLTKAADGQLSLIADGTITAKDITATNVVAKTLTTTGDVAVDGGILSLTSTEAAASTVESLKLTNGTQAVIEGSLKLDGTNKTLTVGTGDDTVGGTTLSAKHIDLNDGMLIVDPDWGLASSNVAVESMGTPPTGTTPATYDDVVLNGRVGVGQNSYLALGTADTTWLPGVVAGYTNGTGLSQTGITAAMGLYKGITIGTGKALLVDGSKMDTATGSALTNAVNAAANNSATFADNSLLVINGADDAIAAGGAAISFETTGTLSVAEGAKLLITDAVAGQAYTIVDNVNAPTATGLAGWKNNGMTSTTDMISLDDAVFTPGSTGAAGTVTTSAKRNDAATVFPNLSDGMANAVNDLYTGHDGAAGEPRWDYADVDSADMGVRFLSRATDNRFLGADKDAAAATIESAARIAFAGAVPQMTKMASDAGTNAVVNRLGFANPADGAQAMDAEGKIVDRNTTGFALWIAPLWQSQHGWGMEADNLDYGFNGNLGGVSLGADYTFENAIRAGITFNIGGGYAESSGGDLNSTENRMSFWGLGAYAGWNYENFGLMADVSYTSTWNDLKQDMDSRMGMGDLEADVQASAISAGLRAEYKLETSVLDVIPHIGVRYMSLNTWGFDAESNGGTVLEGDGFHQDIWTFPVGVTFTKDFTLDSGWSFKPSIDFSVIPAAGDIKAKQDVAFTGLPGSYEVETQMMDYLTWQGGVGLEMGNDTMSFGVNYTLQAGQHTTGHGVFGSFRYEF
ncbi:autotransporter domain-containing protein [Desulfovibrio piger]|uniref:autotransporter domain-containing protein n=1 Tax=Desulfovibrio piger TaxID=901 RepID=UPI0026F29BF7|nr:autotransporter domain-containing protein [Desulfovibrio piger]